MKVLIIGSKGMLGQALVNVFSQDHEVIGWDKEDIDITQIPNSPPDFAFGRSQRRAGKSQIPNLKPHLLINAVAYNNVDGAEDEPEIANAVNGYAVGYLAQVCRGLDIPIVHYSTDYVFDGTKQEGYAEEDSTNPISAYGRSKFLGEQKLQKNTAKFYLIRLSRLFGRKAKATGAKKSFVGKMLETAKTKKVIKVVDEEVSCPTYSLDLARQTEYILESRRPYGIYHATNSGFCTWYNFAREIFKIAKIEVELIAAKASDFERKVARPKYSILINTKLPPMRPWQEALREFLAS